MRTTARHLAGAYTALTLAAAPLLAQSAEAPGREVTARRHGFSVNLGLTKGEAKGSISEGPESGSGGGIAYERPIGARHSWRAEVSIGSVVTDVGLTSDGVDQYESKLNLMRASIGGSVRRYAANGLFVGAAAALKVTYDCHLGRREGGGLFAAGSVGCDETLPPFESTSASPSLALTGGWQTGRWELEFRADQSFGASARSEDRTGTAQTLGAYVHYRFGKRSR
jgi:hypothetical protein